MRIIVPDGGVHPSTFLRPLPAHSEPLIRRLCPEGSFGERKCSSAIPSESIFAENGVGLLSADPRQHEIGRSVLVRCSSLASADRPATNEHK